MKYVIEYEKIVEFFQYKTLTQNFSRFYLIYVSTYVDRSAISTKTTIPDLVDKVPCLIGGIYKKKQKGSYCNL